MPLLLGVNIDHVATLRQARYPENPFALIAEPCPVDAAQDALAGGADSITLHVRRDHRHIQPADAARIRADVPLPLNLELSVTEEMSGLAITLKPDFAGLGPEARREVTTEGGLDVVAGFDKIRMMVAHLQDAGIRVSLFVDPDPKQIDAAAETCAEMIELHTGCYANATGTEADHELARLAAAAKAGHDAALQVNAGHGINYSNITALLTIPHLTELNIGHSIVSRALKVGMTTAVREMKSLMAGYPA